MVKKLSFIYALALLGLMSIIGFYIDNNKKNHDSEISRLKNEKTEYIFNILVPSKNNETIIISNKIKHDIIDSFDEKYKDEDILKKEIYNSLLDNENMTITITSGFKIIDQIPDESKKELEIYDEKIKSEDTKYSILEAVSLAFSFIIIAIIGGLFVYNLDYKK